MKSKSFLKTIGGREILCVPSLEFTPGQIYAVMGSNGCGKSTFAKCIALEKGLVDEDLTVGFMPQKNFAFRMSVLHNALLTAGSREEAVAMLSSLGMGELLRCNAKTLSGGETAKMALARVLLSKTDLLILDEPTTAMDTESTLVSERLIKEYASSHGAAVILITHSVGQARRLANWVFFLDRGHLLEQGPVPEILDHPQTPEAQQFFAL